MYSNCCTCGIRVCLVPPHGVVLLQPPYITYTNIHTFPEYVDLYSIVRTTTQKHVYYYV